MIPLLITLTSNVGLPMPIKFILMIGFIGLGLMCLAFIRRQEAQETTEAVSQKAVSEAVAIKHKDTMNDLDRIIIYAKVIALFLITLLFLTTPQFQQIIANL